jgi:hypothetical protein
MDGDGSRYKYSQKGSQPSQMYLIMFIALVGKQDNKYINTLVIVIVTVTF